MSDRERKKVLRSIPNGLFVITSRDGDVYGGATITWLTQCSFDPPQLVAGVRPGSGIYECLRAGGRAVVHVLADDQVAIAGSFFSSPEVDERDGTPTLAGHPFEAGEHGVPVLSDVPAYATCEVAGIHDGGGDHHLVVLEVKATRLRREFSPLTVTDSPWEYGG